MVLLFPDFNEIKDLSVGGLFTPDYWNGRCLKAFQNQITNRYRREPCQFLQIPGFLYSADFPTEFHTNWQWWPIVKNSRPFILDNTPKNYRPLVQVVDNIERNHKLGLIFEFAVGKGEITGLHVRPESNSE